MNSRSEQDWEDGLTDGDGLRMTVCREGTCDILYRELEAAAVAFHTPNGLAAEPHLERMLARAKGAEHGWLTISARCLVRVYEYFKEVKPRLDRERSLVREAEMVRQMTTPAHVLAGMTAEEYRVAEALRRRERAEATERWDAERLFELGFPDVDARQVSLRVNSG